MFLKQKLKYPKLKKKLVEITNFQKQPKFYDYNPYEDVKNLLVEVPI